MGEDDDVDDDGEAGSLSAAVSARLWPGTPESGETWKQDGMLFTVATPPIMEEDCVEKQHDDTEDRFEVPGTNVRTRL